MLYCNTATVPTTRRVGTGLGARLGAQGARGARRRVCVGRTSGRCRQLGSRAGAVDSGRAGVRSRRGAGTGRTTGKRWARGAGAAWALGARPGRAGWPGLCTRCTPLGFQPGFSTRYFS